MYPRCYRPRFRFLAFGLALCVALFFRIDTPILRAMEADVLTVQAPEGKLHTQPVKIAPVIEMLKQGTEVLLIHQKGEWYAVSLPDLRLGWAHQSIFTPEPAIETAAAAEAMETSAPGRPGRLTVPSGRVRTGPSLDSTLAFGLTRSDRFTVLAKQGDWYHIRAPNGKTGWIYHTLVEVSPPVPKAETAAAGKTAASEATPFAMTATPPEDETEAAVPTEAGTDAMAAAAGQGEEAPADMAETGESAAASGTASAGEAAIAQVTDAPQGPADGFEAVVKVRSGRVRKAPTTSSPMKFGITRGTRIRVIGVEGSWYHIEAPDGRTGWSHQSLFDKAVESRAQPSDKGKSPPSTSSRKILQERSTDKATLVSATPPAANPGPGTATREIRAIRFEETPEGYEALSVELDAFHPPRTYTVDDDTVPMVVCEFTGTRLSPYISRNVPVQGKLVKAVSVRGPEGGDPVVRVEATLDPRYQYSVDQIFYKKNNRYVMIFKR